MIRMPAVDFEVLCGILKNYNTKRKWFWGLINKTDQEEMISQLMRWRPQADKDKKKDEKSANCAKSSSTLSGVGVFKQLSKKTTK